MPLRDVVQVARDPGVDWDRLARWVRRWRLSAALAYAFALVSRELGVGAPGRPPWIWRGSPSRPLERRAIRAYTEPAGPAGCRLAATGRSRGSARRPPTCSGCSAEPPVPPGAGAEPRLGLYVARWRVPSDWIGRQRRARSATHRSMTGTEDLDDR